MDFKPHTGWKPLSENLVQQLLRFAFSTEKRQNTLNVSVRFLTDSKSLRKNVESSAKAVYIKA